MRKVPLWVGWVGAGSCVVVASMATLLRCADPREDEQVVVVTSCAPDSGVFERLSTQPSSPESAVVEYVTAAEALSAKTAELNQTLTAACNEIDTELGVSTGTDPTTACQPIAQAIAEVNNTKADAGGGGTWYGLTYPPICQVDPNAQATCLKACSVSDAGACDNTQCAPEQRSSTCSGLCIGQCQVASGADASAPCTGQCQGTCINIGADGGPFANNCTGECNGLCSGTSFNGFCGAGCGSAASSSKLFKGECDGTCTGTCNGATINGGIPDGGLGPEAGVPTGSDGNCAGLCVGWCSSNASGVCPFGCATTNFNSGVCTTCKSTCVSGVGAGCAGSCDGICTFATDDAGTSCPGTCLGTCVGGSSTAPACSGNLSCNQNKECNNACEALTGTTVSCTSPDSIEVETVSNVKLYNALKKSGKLGQALQALVILRNAQNFIADRQLSDFYAIGASGEVVRACVARGQAAAKQANANISIAVNADPTK